MNAIHEKMVLKSGISHRCFIKSCLWAFDVAGACG